MKMEQQKNFLAALKRLGEEQGERCAPNNGREHHGEPFPDDAYVMSAAVSMSVLVTLREMARDVKGLTPNHIQSFIDGFFEAAQVKETYGAMGGLIYKRDDAKEAA